MLTTIPQLSILSHIIYKEKIMTDITRYKIVSLSKENYKDIQVLSKEIFDVPLSLSKTIEWLAQREIKKAKKTNSHGQSK